MFKLEKPYNNIQKSHFIVDFVQNGNRKMMESEISLYALEQWEELINDEVFDHKAEWELEQLKILKSKKFDEATQKAKEFIQNGFVEYKGVLIETDTDTIGNLHSTRDLLVATGQISYEWLSKEDKFITLNVDVENPMNDDFVLLGIAVEEFKKQVWTEKYLYFKLQIENAKTVEEVESIEISY